MKKLFKFQYLLIAVLFTGTVVFNSCKKDPPKPDPDPEEEFTSDSVARENLIAKFSFEDNITDAKENVTGGTATFVTYGTGVKGKCYTGADSAYAVYTNPGSVKDLTGLTVAFWIKTTQHTDGAECVFMLNNAGSWIGDLFLLQESGVDGNDSIRFKFRISDWGEGVSWHEQWIDFGGEQRFTGILGEWSHLAFTYDGPSSKFNAFVNGVKLILPAEFTDRLDGDGGAPLGDLLFNTAGNTHFIFGTYQNIVSGSGYDTWMKDFNGEMDEFRIYNKALNEGEIDQLYDLEIEEGAAK